MSSSMKINFITEPAPGWILRRASEAWSQYIPGSKVSTKVDPSYTVNFFVNYNLYKSVDTKTVAWFTHREGGELSNCPLARRFDYVSSVVDLCACQCEKTLDVIKGNNKFMLSGGVDQQFIRLPIVIGIVGRHYESGRKNFDWINDIEKINGIKVKFTDGKLKYEELPDFYESINYLVVTSSVEGGPVPVIEAIAMGKPVIAPDVGYCWNYPVIRYDGSKFGLVSVLKKLVIGRNTWSDEANVIVEQCKKFTV